MKIAVVWFKRDLRTTDHLALKLALKSGLPVCGVYLFEPSLLKHELYSERHHRFICQSIAHVKSGLEAYGIPFFTFENNAEVSFSMLAEHYEIQEVFGHAETGIDLTFKRDLQMKSWFKAKGITWSEFQSNGIHRGRRDRYRWKEQWYSYMNQPLDQPDFLAYEHKSFQWSVDFSSATAHVEISKHFQPGGERNGMAYLKSFFESRGKSYAYHISKPAESRTSCSRISPYLAWGNMSVRQAYQASKGHENKLGWKRSIQGFQSRLRWHCHFIQKFEMESSSEFELFNEGYSSIPFKKNLEHFERWKNGRTGIPLVDACMRCLTETGYINFRMRAMLVSFHSHHLFLHWKQGADYLAQLFLDFEPGIHFPQFQMQSGLTGIHALRIYNPTKQSQDHDPEGAFIKKWIPELSEVPIAFIHEPWKMTAIDEVFEGVNVPKLYKQPIVNVEAAARDARDLIWSWRKRESVQEESERILKKHTLPGRMT